MSDLNLTQHSIQQIDNILSRHREKFADDLQEILRRTGGTAVGGFMGMQGGFGGNKSKDLRDELQALVKALGGKGVKPQTLTAYERYMLDSAKRQLAAMNKSSEAIKAEGDARGANSEEIRDNSKAFEKHKEQVERASDKTKGFIKGLAEGTLHLKGLDEVVREVKTSFKTGFNWNHITDTWKGVMMGMDPSAMMEFQAEYRRASGALRGGVDQFNRVISQNQYEMHQFTGDLKSANMTMAAFYDISHTMGLELEDVGSAADGLYRQFKRMHIATSITADQFVDLTRKLTSNSDIQDKLLGLNNRQRSAYVQNLIGQQYQLELLGLQKEAATALIVAAEARGNKSGLERYQESVKLQALLTNMPGVSPEKAARIAQLNYLRNPNEEQRLELEQSRMELAAIYQNLRGGDEIGGLTSHAALAFEELYKQLGNDFFEGGQAGLQLSAAKDPIALANHSNEIAKRSENMLNQIGGHASMIVDMMKAYSGSALAVAVAAVIGSVLLRSSGPVDAIIDRVLRRKNNIPVGGKPGQPAAASWRNSLALSGAGRAGIGMAIGAGSYMAADAIADQSTSPVANGAIKGAGAGAGIGMLLGPKGALLGGLLGGAIGGIIELHRIQMQSADRVGSIVTDTTSRMTVEKQVFAMQRDAAQRRLSALQAENNYTADHIKLVKQAQADLDALNERSSYTEVSNSITAGSLAMSTLGKMGDRNYRNTGDITSDIARIQELKGIGGINGNTLQVLLDNISLQSLNHSLSHRDTKDLQQLTAALAEGKDVKIPASMRTIFQHALKETVESERSAFDDMDLNATGLDRGSIQLSVQQLQAAVKEKEDEIQRLENERSGPKSYKGGFLGMDNQAITNTTSEQALALAREQRLHQQQTLEFWQRLQGDASINVVIANPEAVGKELARRSGSGGMPLNGTQ